MRTFPTLLDYFHTTLANLGNDSFSHLKVVSLQQHHKDKVCHFNLQWERLESDLFQTDPHLTPREEKNTSVPCEVNRTILRWSFSPSPTQTPGIKLLAPAHGQPTRFCSPTCGSQRHPWSLILGDVLLIECLNSPPFKSPVLEVREKKAEVLKINPSTFMLLNNLHLPSWKHVPLIIYLTVSSSSMSFSTTSSSSSSSSSFSS
jgi:hypothetical protein